MNTKTTLLVASLVMNALLLGAEAYLVTQDPGDLRSQAPLIICVGGHGSIPGEKTVAHSATAAEPAVPLGGLRIESNDYRQYVAHLRSMGCSEKTIREMVTADVIGLFRTRAQGELYSSK